MCPCHVAFEDIETIRKFPKLQEVTYSLIIEKIKSSLLCINTQLFTCLPIFGQCFTDLTFLSYIVIQFAINNTRHWPLNLFDFTFSVELWSKVIILPVKVLRHTMSHGPPHGI